MEKTAAVTVCLLWLLLLLAVLTSASSPSTSFVPHTETTENSWTTKQPMPTARIGLGVAVVNGKIYAIGGSNLYTWYNTNEEYDPATNTWTTKKPMPTARSDFGIAVYQNKIYVIGGETGFSDYTWANEVYDPLTDTWETKTHMPSARAYLDANVVNGKIYLIGGLASPYYPWPTSDKNDVYDPATDSWTSKALIPTADQGYASAVANNKIYVIGGGAFVNPIDHNQIYDPETDTWSYGAPLPTDVYRAAAGATTGVMAPKRIYVIGGYTSGYTNLTQVYDPERDIWTTGTPMPTPRSSFGVAVINDVLYAIGGRYGDNILAVNEQYTPFGYGTFPPPDTTPPFPITWIVATTAIIAIGGAALLVYFAKVKKTTGKTE